MISFLLNTYRLIKSIVLGITKDQEFRILIFLIFTLLVGSVIFYINVEGWTVIDALYFSVMTMATIGYGDFTPSSDLSKIFTVIFTFLSVGIFASVIAKIAAIQFRSSEKKIKKTKL